MKSTTINTAISAHQASPRLPVWLRLGDFVARIWRRARLRHPTWLILKPGSLGDALLFSGALQKMRQEYPGHRLVLATSQRAAAIFERTPGWDNILVVDEKELAQSGFASRWRRFVFAIRLLALRYDGVLYPFYGDPTRWSHPIYPLLAAKRKIHFANQYPPETVFPASSLAVPVEHGLHEIDKMATILRAAGCQVQDRRDIWPELVLREDERAFAQEVVARSTDPSPPASWPPNRQPETLLSHDPKFDSGGNLEPGTQNPEPTTSAWRALRVAVCAGARFKCKAWPEERYADLLAHLAAPEFLAPRGYDRADFFLLGDAGDGESNEKIIAKVRAAEPQSSRATEQQSHRAAACHGVVAKRSREPQTSSAAEGRMRGSSLETLGPGVRPGEERDRPSEFSGQGTEPGTRNPEPNNEERRTKNEEHTNAPTLANLAGQTSIHQAAAVIEACDLCIGNDTFGLHAAIAVGTPSVVIMWGGSGDQWIPWGDPEKHRMVRADIVCRGCGGNCCKKSFHCMERISVDMVMEEAVALLEPTQTEGKSNETKR